MAKPFHELCNKAKIRKIRAEGAHEAISSDSEHSELSHHSEFSSHSHISHHSKMSLYCDISPLSKICHHSDISHYSENDQTYECSE